MIASKFINSTNCNVFLTGRAGTGKTTFLHSIRQSTHKSAIVAAPTGIAAINAGGVTLHSLFQLPFGSFIPSEQYPGDIPPGLELNTPLSVSRNLKMHATKRNMLKKLELLIIDEVSMLRADLLDAIDTILRRVRWRRHLPFGGVQVLFIGDLQQLPPVVKDNEWQILREYYPTLFFFGAQVLRNNEPVYIELDHIYRQTDKKFISVLNNLRDSKMTSQDVELLNRHYKPGFTAAPGEGYVYLTTHNNKADKINRSELDKLPGKSFQYSANVEGTFDTHIFPVNPVLELKNDAQVMFIKNDTSGEQRFFNGKIGKVESLDKGAVKVGFPDGSPSVRVESHTWENKRYTLNTETNEIEEKVVGTFAHLPLKLAWAITVHKSQGLTFDRAIIDVSQAFAAGQIYVALSRLTSLDGLVLSKPFELQNIPREPALEAFIRQKAESRDLGQSLQAASLAYLGQEVRAAFDLRGLWADLDFHLRSYTKDAAHSKKQKHLEWAQALQADLGPVKAVGDKFLMQLNRILQSVSESMSADSEAHLHERVSAARGYFEPLLIGFSERIKTLADELKNEKKGVKKYIKELQDLEVLFYGQLQKCYKALGLIEAFQNDEELTKAGLNEPEHRDAIVVGGTGGGKKGFREKKRNEVEKRNNKPGNKPDQQSDKKAEKKIETKLLSLEMLNEGKTVEEIAEERALRVMTIETHLAHWIEQGVLEVGRFVPKEALEEITKGFEGLGTEFLKPVKELFEGKYDYGTLRFALAELRRIRE